MVLGGWGPRSFVTPYQQKFCERVWSRKSLAEWDARWLGLSIPARLAFLQEVKAPPKPFAGGSPGAGAPATSFKPDVLKELTTAGFVRVQAASSAKKPDRVITNDVAASFRTRIRALFRIRLLDPSQEKALLSFINTACYPSRLVAFVSDVLHNAGLDLSLTEEGAYSYLTSARWPEVALKATKDPIARQILEVIQKSAAPVPLDDLPKRIKKSDPTAVRLALDTLIEHLAVFEDLNPKTFAIELGLLPQVRKKIEAAATRTQRPPLVAVETPRDLGPDTGLFIDDLRAFLLEVASEPPRLRQDGEIFSKEHDRFLQAQMSLPPWLNDSLAIDSESRMDNAYSEASTLKLVKEHRDGKALQLQLTPRGQTWLSADTKDQYTQVFDEFGSLPRQNSGYYPDFDPYDGMSSPYYGYYSYSSILSDRVFLGSDFAVVPPRAGKNGKKSTTPTVDDLKALREAIGKALMALPEGTYYRVDNVIEHLVSGDQNVLLLGHAQEDLRVFFGSQPIPPLDELREQVGRRILLSLVMTRLIPLGGFRAAVDSRGELLIARTSRLAAYFGLGPMPDLAGSGSGDGSRVVVQPDFSVVVIGLSTAALAELIPFCDRSSPGSAGPGASILKITRESVTRAVAQGLKPSQILDRLRKHASNEPPANVIRQVQDWANWVKTVYPARVTLLRCPDRDTADRVLGVLKKQVDRLNDTTLAVYAEKISPADRKKLRDNGVLLGTTTGIAFDDETGPRTKSYRAKRRLY